MGKRFQRLFMLLLISCLSSQLVYVNAKQYEYDKLNRLTKVTYEDGSYITYEYDKNGNLERQEVHNVSDTTEEDGSSTVSNEIKTPDAPSVRMKTLFQVIFLYGRNDTFTKADITWDTVDGISEYSVYRSTKRNGEYTKIKTVIDGSQYMDYNLKGNTRYYYKLRYGKEIDGMQYESPYSALAKCSFTTPESPKNLDSGKNESGSICITWSQADKNKNFMIFQSNQADGVYRFYKVMSHAAVCSCIGKKGNYYRICSYKIVDKRLIFSKFSESVYAE